MDGKTGFRFEFDAKTIKEALGVPPDDSMVLVEERCRVVTQIGDHQSTPMLVVSFRTDDPDGDIARFEKHWERLRERQSEEAENGREDGAEKS
jgi:hypothetical protein